MYPMPVPYLITCGHMWPHFLAVVPTTKKLKDSEALYFQELLASVFIGLKG